MEDQIHRREVVLLDNPDQVKVDVHQVMNPLHPDVFNSLKDSIWAEGILVPLLLDKNWAVIDGHNRVHAWHQLLDDDVQIGKVPAMVYDAATKYDAYRIAVTTNSVRRDPTEAKPELVRKQLMWLDHMYEAAGDPPDDRRSWTDGRIASTIGIARDSVRDIRGELEASGEIAASRRRIGVQIRNGKRVEVSTDVALARAKAEQTNQITRPTTTSKPSSNGSLEPKTVEVPTKVNWYGNKLTPEEAAAKLIEINKEKNDLKKAKEGAETAEKNLQKQIDERIENARLAFLQEVANVKARYGEVDPPELIEVDEDAWIAMAQGAANVRVKEAGDVVKKLYNGFPEMMGLYMPGEAAQSVLGMQQAAEIQMGLEFIRRWIDGVIEELENEESLAQQRARR